MVGFRVDEAILSAATNLEWFQVVTAGVGHLPTEQLRETGAVLTNASGVHAEPVAEQVFGYLLTFERDLTSAHEQQRRHEFRHYLAGELKGKTLGILGVGAIGERVAELGQAFGMAVLGTKRDPSEGSEFVDDLRGSDATQWVSARSDYLVVACPLTEETHHLVGAEELASMPSDAVLVNTARGAVVDTEELLLALQQGRLGGAALDVFETEPLPSDSPLWNLSNVLITPHVAGGTEQYWDRCADIFAQNYEAFTAGNLEEMVNRV
jgi:phosphoglycerate dehydrogenase-like enzyme